MTVALTINHNFVCPVADDVDPNTVSPGHWNDTHAITGVGQINTELAAKADKTTTVTAGAGLTGGGDLSANRTLDVVAGAGGGLTVNANDVVLDTAHARNVDHTGVTITAGAGLTGGGAIDATRTLDVGGSTSIIVGADDVQRAALTGDVTAAQNVNATVIANNAVSYAKMQDVSATARVLGRKTAAAGDPEECTLTEVLDMIGSAARGDILYRGASGWAKLAASTAGFLLQTGGAAGDPSWVTAPTTGVPTGRLVTAGAGLTGGGDLSLDRTLDVGAGTGITVAADSVGLDTAHNRNVDHSTIVLTAGAGMTGGGDTTASRTFDVIAGAGGGLTVNANDVVLDTTHNRNVDHSTIVLTAGAGMTGGGDTTASRTFDVIGSTSIIVGANDVQRAALTGDVTAAQNVNGTTIAADAVTYAKMQNVTAASRLLGRGSAGGAGDPEEILLGTGLSMSGTTLSGSGGGRERLTAARTYYVSGGAGSVYTGSDANTGLADNAGGAFLTIQRALSAVWDDLDLDSNNVTIQVRTGTYAASSVAGPLISGAFGTCTLTGDTTTPGNCIINSTTFGIGVSGGAILRIQGFRFTGNAAHIYCHGETAGGASTVFLTGLCEFGPTTNEGHICAKEGGNVIIVTNYTILTGAHTSHLGINMGGRILYRGARTITLQTTPSFSTGFASLAMGGGLRCGGQTFTGAATGQRYIVTSKAWIDTGVAGETYLPGNSTGDATQGGNYDGKIGIDTIELGAVADSTLSRLSAGLLGMEGIALRQERNFNLIGGTLVASVAASALTVAVKTDAGADPSAANPVYVNFRNATVANGDWATLAITAATSIVVTSGATLGTLNATAFRVWIVGFNDAGTFRLGVINCLTRLLASSYYVHPLAPWAVQSSTIMSATADVAGVFYTGTAVSAKAFTVLGFLDWDTGLATAGTWSAGPTRISLFGQGMPLPGATLQHRQYSDTTTSSTTSSAYSASVVTGAITPTSAQNIIRVHAHCIVASAVNAACGNVLRRGTSVDLSDYGQFYSAAADIRATVSVFAMDGPGVATSTSYTLYIASENNTSTVTCPVAGGGNPKWLLDLVEVMA